MNLYLEKYIIPDWPKPKNIHAYCSTRLNGHSQGLHQKFNLATDVNDQPQAVSNNLADLKKELQLPNDPFWLKQIHSDIVVNANDKNERPEADASIAFESNQVCVIQTADCMPILLASRNGDRIAAIHAGWRGLAKNIISATVNKLNISGNELMAWLGPAICQKHYEVGNEVREQFLRLTAENKDAFIASNNANKWFCDLYFIARKQLQSLDIQAIYGGKFCTYEDNTHFYSYRRDGKQTGRMVTLIYNEKNN